MKILALTMNQVFVILLLFCLVSNEQLNSCSQLDNISPQSLWNYLNLKDFNKYFILVAGIISLVLLLMAALTWLIYPSFSPPSDIMLMIIIVEFVQNTAYVAQAIYFTIYPSDSAMPSNFRNTCIGLGGMLIAGNIASIYYNMIFCVILSYSIRNTLKGFFFNQFRYHIMSAFITIGVVLILIFTSGIGRGFNGLCGYKAATQQSIARFILQLFITGICIYSMAKFKSKIPQNEYFQQQSVFGYYYYYMGIFAGLQVLESISSLIGDLICKNSTLTNSNQNVIQTFNSVNICINITMSYVLFALRFSHPILIKKIKRKLNKQNKVQLIHEKESQNQYLPELLIQQQDKDQWLGCLLQSLKGSQILSFVEGLMISFLQKNKRMISQFQTLYYKKHYIFKVNQKIAQDYASRRISNRESLMVKQKLGGLNALPYTITSYCQDAFSSISSMTQISQLIKSFDIRKNINIVKKSSYTNGGKSGQFFFCTYDNKFIFKTIKEDQANAYLEKIRYFHEYFREFNDTLIVKILGLYKFERNDIKQQPVYIILMKNLTENNKDFNVRVYDIKGSEFNRSAMQEKNLKQEEDEKLKRFTLKDKDFKALESRVKVQSQVSSKLKQVLKRDVQFLGKMGFMDYSLLIIKRTGLQNSNRGFSQIRSSTQEDILYNFGIIDYLQSWNLKRKAQRALKTLITNQQVTANSPLNYSARLSHFLDSII